MLNGNHWTGWRRDLRAWAVFGIASALRWIAWRCEDVGAVRAEDAFWRAYLWTIEGERWT